MMYCLTEEEYRALKNPTELEKLKQELGGKFNKAVADLMRDAGDIFSRFGGFNSLDRSAFLKEIQSCVSKHAQFYKDP